MAVFGLIFRRFRLVGIEFIEVLTIDVARDLRARHRGGDVTTRLRSVKWRRCHVVSGQSMLQRVIRP